MEFGTESWDCPEQSEQLTKALFGEIHQESKNKKRSKEKSKKELKKETELGNIFLKNFNPAQKKSKVVHFKVSDNESEDEDKIRKRTKKNMKERERKKKHRQMKNQEKAKQRKETQDSDEEMFAELDGESLGDSQKMEKPVKTQAIQNLSSDKQINNTQEIKKKKRRKKKKQSKDEAETNSEDINKVTNSLKRKLSENPFIVTNTSEPKKKKKKHSKNEKNSMSDTQSLTKLHNKQNKNISQSWEGTSLNPETSEVLTQDNKTPENSEKANSTKSMNVKYNSESISEVPLKQKKKKQKLNSSMNNGQSEPKSVKTKKPPSSDLENKVRNTILPEGGTDIRKKNKQNKNRETLNSPKEKSNNSISIKSDKNKKFDKSKLARILSKSPGAVTSKKNLSESKTVDKTLNQINRSTDNSVDDRKKKQGMKSLKERMTDQLNEARFRFINEQLYTQSSSEAVEMFKSDQKSFEIYHEGFQSQVSKWPVNPVNIFIKQLKKLPTTRIIADLGCGSAMLAQSVSHTVHSFDLVQLNEYVTVCDIAKLPLETKSVDVAVFCLSLMGTNIGDYVSEANRILKPQGELMIAEVESRIKDTNRFITQIESYGFIISNKDVSHKMFHLFYFKKIKPSSMSAIKDIQLDPCIYKKR